MFPQRLNREEVITLIKIDPERSDLRAAAEEIYKRVVSVNSDNLVGEDKKTPNVTKECDRFRKLFIGINYELPTSDKLLYNEIILPIFLPKVVKD
jgi:hypothetical protein